MTNVDVKDEWFTPKQKDGDEKEQGTAASAL